MATLQVRNLDDKVYRKLKAKAAAEHRSLTQHVMAVLEEHVNKPEPRANQARLADLAGAWKDDRSAEEIIRNIRASRRSGHRPKVEF